MRSICISVFITLISIYCAHGFEIDGLTDGMSMEQAKSIIQKFSYNKIEVNDNHIGAWDYPERGT